MSPFSPINPIMSSKVKCISMFSEQLKLLSSKKEHLSHPISQTLLLSSTSVVTFLSQLPTPLGSLHGSTLAASVNTLVFHRRCNLLVLPLLITFALTV